MSEPLPLAEVLKVLDEPPAGPPMCIQCDAVEVERFGRMCAKCLDARAATERREALMRAWATVPESMRATNFSAPHLADFVSDREAIAIAKESISRPLVTLVGETRAGKTTLATCMLREIIAAGWAKTASPQIIARARRARFAIAGDLVRAASQWPRGKGEHAPVVRAALEASVLVLDEVGGDGLPDPDRVIFDVLHTRHRALRQTIVTTGLDRAGIAATISGGIAARLFEDGFVIHVRKGAA